MQQEMAETIGLQALGWLVTNDELLPVFMGSTGSDAEAIKQSAKDPAFLSAVLDFLTMDDAWVMAFCDATGLGYDQPNSARLRLSGDIHWT